MPAVVWLVIGVALCAGELLTLDLVLLMLGTAALVTSGAALLTGALLAQVLAFVATSLVLLAVVRPVARRHLNVVALPSGHEQLPGRRALVVQPITAASGQVRINGELWRARPYRGVADVPVGAYVVVASVAGATLEVYPEEL